MKDGYSLLQFSLDPEVRDWVKSEDWDRVDLYFRTEAASTGRIFQEVQREFRRQFPDLPAFYQIETMISIRDSTNPDEEDGIWHDDGSRVFAFSLSLTIDPSTEGKLELRRKGSEEITTIDTPEFGTAIVFLTGIHGYEHRTRAVTRGRRIILVGWCT